MSESADEVALRNEEEYWAEEQEAKEEALYAKINDLDWRLQQLEERMRLA